MPECLGYGMLPEVFYNLDHFEIGSYLKGNRDREKRLFKQSLAIEVRASMALANKVLLGLGGKPYTEKMARVDFPELYEKPAKAQTWQEQERIFRKFLKMPERSE